MIDRKRAEAIKVAVLTCISQLDSSVKDALKEAPEEHASVYRRMAGQTMGLLFTEVLMPIYAAYPDLEPSELRLARNHVDLTFMPRETGAKLMAVNSSVSETLSNLRKDLEQSREVDASPFGLAFREPINALQDIHEFLRRVCPDLGEL